MNREAIYAALFGLLSGAAGFVTASRSLLPWDNLGGAQQPALMMIARREKADRGESGLPPRWHLGATVVVCVQTDESGAEAPDQQMNPLLDAVGAAVTPPTGDPQTLGGLASYCYVDGNLERFPGSLANQAVAIVPITVVTTG